VNPGADTDLIDRFIQLRQRDQQMRPHIDWCSIALQGCNVQARGILELNAAIAEEDRRLMDTISVEMGEERPMCLCEPAEADLPIGTVAGDVDALQQHVHSGVKSNSVCRQTGLRHDFEQGLLASTVSSPAEVTGPYASSSSSSRPQLEHCPQSLISNSRTQHHITGGTFLCESANKSSASLN